MFALIRTSIFLSLLALSGITTAASALTEHALSVSQSMSAFYMYTLTDGDKRYQDDYEKYFALADQSLVRFQKQNKMVATELNNKWSKLRLELKFEFVDGAGFIIPDTVRVEFRKYLSLLYKKINEVSYSESNLSVQLALMVLDVEIMSARFFDLSTTLYGDVSIYTTDSIDPVKMAAVFNEQLKKFQKMQLSSAVQKNLGSASRKWNFIQDSVINYKGEAAYFLVYYNKHQINKLLNKSQLSIAKV